MPHGRPIKDFAGNGEAWIGNPTRRVELPLDLQERQDEAMLAVQALKASFDRPLPKKHRLSPDVQVRRDNDRAAIAEVKRQLRQPSIGTEDEFNATEQ